MSALIERLKEVQKKAKPSLDRWVDGLDDEDREAWAAACVNPAVSTAALMAIVRDEGVAVGKDAMAAHRRGHGLAR